MLFCCLGYGCFSALLWIFLDDGKVDGAGRFALLQGSGGWRNVAAVCVGRCAGIVGFFLVWELCLVN